MSLPVILLLSSDADLVTAFKARLGDNFTILAVEHCDEAAVLARLNRPASVVADFRPIFRGGHSEARFLDQIKDVAPGAMLIVLAPAECPEPIERQIACYGISPVRGAAGLDSVFQQVLSLKPAPEPEPEAAANTDLDDTECDFVLNGLSRRFETNTPKLRMMLADLEVAARHDVTVLLIGETGSGKTYLSKLIHEISPRHDEPFLPLACGALPADLIESELFGHVKGAFTSAVADKDGKFVAARRGTILLDEIDVLGMEQQVKLLRVIESGEFEPVGSNRTMKSEARLIVASNLELQPLVEQKRFRPDLYYRLNMLKFEIPPLRARRPDIIPLAKKFIREQSLKHNVQVERIDESLFSALLKYPWPGNVRELEHVIQRAVIYSRGGVLTAQQLPAHVVMCMAGPANDGSAFDEQPVDVDASRTTLGRQVAFSEREIIEQALFKHGQSRTSTAKALGISRVTLYNKMKKYGMMQ